MKVLFISRHFAPSIAVGSKRPSELALYLSNENSVTVIAGRVGKTNCQWSEETRITKVIRLPSFPKVIHSTWSRIKTAIYWPSKSPDSNQYKSDRQGNKNNWLRSLYHAVHGLFDEDKGWGIFSLLTAFFLRLKNRQDVVVASGPPSIAYVVGVFAAKLNKCALIIDIRDPWIPNSNWAHKTWRSVRETIERPFERLCFLRSQAILVASPGSKRIILNRYPELGDKVHLVLNGSDDRFANLSKPVGRTLRLLFAGSLYMNRSPIPIFETIKNLIDSGFVEIEKISFELFGNCKEWKGIDLVDWVLNKNLDGVIKFYSYLDTEMLLEHIESANLLINLAQTQCDQIPAKLYEYSASGREVLSLAETDSDTAWVHKELGFGFVVEPGSQDHLREILIQMYDRALSSDLFVAETEGKVITRAMQNKQMVDIISSSVGQFYSRVIS